MADKAASSPQTAAVHLYIREIPEACDSLCRHEAYELVIAAEGISIAAENPAGVFYGIQSLLQLLPWNTGVPDSYPTLQGCRIVDYPRFQWYVYTLLLDTSTSTCAPSVCTASIQESRKGCRSSISRYCMRRPVTTVLLQAGCVAGHRPAHLHCKVHQEAPGSHGDPQAQQVPLASH